MPGMSDPNKTRAQSQVSGYDALVLISARTPTRNAFAVSLQSLSPIRMRPEYGLGGIGLPKICGGSNAFTEHSVHGSGAVGIGCRPSDGNWGGRQQLGSRLRRL